MAMAIDRTEAFEKMSVNHLEGRTAAFFCYADKGGDEIDAPEDHLYCNISNTLIPMRNRTKMRETRIFPWSGSAGMAA